MSRLLFMVPIAVGLAACAQTVWDKPGATQADFQRDAYQCEKDARQSGYFGGGFIGQANFQGFQERCMMAAGYTKRVQR